MFICSAGQWYISHSHFQDLGQVLIIQYCHNFFRMSGHPTDTTTMLLRNVVKPVKPLLPKIVHVMHSVAKSYFQLSCHTVALPWGREKETETDREKEIKKEKQIGRERDEVIRSAVESHYISPFASPGMIWGLDVCRWSVGTIVSLILPVFIYHLHEAARQYPHYTLNESVPNPEIQNILS